MSMTEVRFGFQSDAPESFSLTNYFLQIDSGYGYISSYTDLSAGIYGDFDSHAIYVTPGDSYSLIISPGSGVFDTLYGLSPALEPNVAIYDTDGNVLRVGTDYGPYSGFAFTPLASKYYITTWAESFGTYSVTLANNDVKEQNGTGEWIYVGNTYSAALDTTSDIDKFAFTATAGKRHYFDLNTNISDIFVSVIDAYGKSVLYDTIAGSGLYYLDATSDAVYDVQVSSNSFRSTGDYSFYFTDNLGKAVFSNAIFSGDVVVGNEITSSISISDADGNSDNEINNFWYLGDGDLSNGLDIIYDAFDEKITLSADWAGKTLYFSKAFEDDAGNVESSLSLYQPNGEATNIANDMSNVSGIYKVGVIASETTYIIPTSGLTVDHTGATNVAINAPYNLSLYDEGIFVTNTGTGSTTITATGTVRGGVAQTDQTANSDGIYAYNETTTKDLSITAKDVTGLDDGISAINKGSGVLSIAVTGDVTSTSTHKSSSDEHSTRHYGIHAESYGTDVGVSIYGDVISNDRGVFAWNYGNGETSITSTGTVTAGYHRGIYAENDETSTASDITIKANNVNAFHDGIVAFNYGSGSTEITSTGTVKGGVGQTDQTANSDGIYAYNETTTKDLSITAKDVTGLDDGIEATNKGTGSLSILVTGDVTSTSTDTSDTEYSYGIDASGSGTDVIVSTAGDVTSNDGGLFVWNFGSGDTSITANGTVTALNSAAIYANNMDTSTASDITINAKNANGFTDGIAAFNDGSGSTTITATGTVIGGVGETDQTADSDGIYAQNGSIATDLSITAKDVTGLDDGIEATNKGTGSLSILVTGDVTSTSTDKSDTDYSYGIYAENVGTDVIVSTAGDVTSNDRGVFVSNEGSGKTNITSKGTVTAVNSGGIDVLNGDTSKDLSITAHEVSAYNNGIGAINFGTGSTTITTTGAVKGGNFQTDLAATATNGIAVLNTSAATDITITVQDVTGLQGGITANNFGTGKIEINVSGNVVGLGSESAGIATSQSESSIIVSTFATVSGTTEGIKTDSKADTVTVNGSVTGLNGTAILLGGGNDTVNLGTTATITGTIEGGTGSDTASFSVAKSAVDTFTYNDTTKIAVVTVDSQVTTFKDFEYFKFSDDTSAMTTAAAVTAVSMLLTPHSVADIKFWAEHYSEISISWTVNDFDFVSQTDLTPFTAEHAAIASVTALNVNTSVPNAGRAVAEAVVEALKIYFPSEEEIRLTESIGALSVVNSGTSTAPVLDFYLDSSKDPGDAGVTSIDVALKFDPTHASFTSFSFADGLLGAANEASAADGTITFGAIALTPISTDKPLFTMMMADLDSANDFTVTVSDLNVDGSALEGSTLVVGSPSSHAVTTSVVTRDGSKIADADIIMSDGTNSSSYKSAANGSVSGELASGSASTVTGSLAYSSSTKAISSQDALDALKLSVGMTTAAGTQTAFDYISADFNQDGKVSSQDALSILKYSVGLTTPEQAKWVFVDTNVDHSGIGKSNTSYTEGVSIADLSADTTVSLTGILIGDVNDSYSGLIA